MYNTLREIEREVLEKIRPTSIQLSLLSRFYRLVKRVVEPCLSEKEVDADVTVQGSFAKGTLLRDKWEIDVFIIIKGRDKAWLRSEAEHLLVSCLQGRLPYWVRYSEQPYVKISMLGLEADVVPIVEARIGVLEGLGAERTPLHTRYVTKKLDEKLRDEVRLLKSFLKGIGAYGAETHIRGFSGYLAELLIIYYGSFENTIKAASKWKPGVYIDIEGNADREFLERKYRDSPLIIVDPVDPLRNAAGGVSREKMALFVVASKIFLEKPYRFFFHVFQPEEPLLPALRGCYISLECSGRLEDKPSDAIWGKLSRAARSLVEYLSSNGFNPLYYLFDSDEYKKAVIQVLLDSCMLPEVEARQGPLAWEEPERLVKFISKRLREQGHSWLSGEQLRGARRRKTRKALDAVAQWWRTRGKPILGGLGLKCSASEAECSRGSPVCSPSPAWMLSLLQA